MSSHHWQYAAGIAQTSTTIEYSGAASTSGKSVRFKVDPTVLARFGFRASDSYGHVCRSCKQRDAVDAPTTQPPDRRKRSSST
jgi:hypothetical protein